MNTCRDVFEDAYADICNDLLINDENLRWKTTVSRMSGYTRYRKSACLTIDRFRFDIEYCSESGEIHIMLRYMNSGYKKSSARIVTLEHLVFKGNTNEAIYTNINEMGEMLRIRTDKIRI